MRCLAALDGAAGAVGLPLEVVVVLDACVDDSADVVRAAAGTLSCQVHAVNLDARSVGTARRIGVERVLDLHGAGEEVWVATTDADSVVPANWFERQLAHRSAGADVVVGTVHVTAWEDRLRLRPQWEREYLRKYQADGHRHVHGANLSFRGESYRRVGGFADVRSDEDVRLVRDFAAAGEEIVWATDLSVATSARRAGRAPRGFASYLNDLGNRVTVAEPADEAS